MPLALDSAPSLATVPSATVSTSATSPAVVPGHLQQHAGFIGNQLPSSSCVQTAFSSTDSQRALRDLKRSAVPANLASKKQCSTDLHAVVTSTDRLPTVAAPDSLAVVPPALVVSIVHSHDLTDESAAQHSSCDQLPSASSSALSEADRNRPAMTAAQRRLAALRQRVRERQLRENSEAPASESAPCPTECNGTSAAASAPATVLQPAPAPD